eukprot:1158086-Pelagomonas_calceolata.AAC.5
MALSLARAQHHQATLAAAEEEAEAQRAAAAPAGTTPKAPLVMTPAMQMLAPALQQRAGVLGLGTWFVF